MEMVLPSPAGAPASSPVLRPVKERDRIDSVDVIRGVSVLGILLMNIVGMGLPNPAYGDPSGWGGDTGWNLRVWFINSLCFEGTMRAMFSMLFGAGVLLFTGKDEVKGAGLSVADAWYRRTIWLFIFGMIHAYILLWPGDILYSYGLMGLFLFPLRNMRPGRLFALGTALLLAGAAAYFVANLNALSDYAKAAAAEKAVMPGQSPSEDQQKAIDAWKDRVGKIQPEMKEKQEVVRKMQGGYFSAMKRAATDTYYYESEMHYRFDYFDVLSMMILGMALFKWRVFHAELPSRTYLLMVLVGYGVGLPVNWYESVTYMGDHFSVVSSFQTGRTYDLGRIAMMTGHIGLIMLFCKWKIMPWLGRRLAAVGRMALTNYIVDTLITTTVFVCFAQFGKWERHQLYYLVLGIWVCQLVVSPVWLRYFHFGPVEWLWRSLTYLRVQPFRRKSSNYAGM